MSETCQSYCSVCYTAASVSKWFPVCLSQTEIGSKLYETVVIYTQNCIVIIAINGTLKTDNLRQNWTKIDHYYEHAKRECKTLNWGKQSVKHLKIVTLPQNHKSDSHKLKMNFLNWQMHYWLNYAKCNTFKTTYIFHNNHEQSIWVHYSNVAADNSVLGNRLERITVTVINKIIYDVYEINHRS